MVTIYVPQAVGHGNSIHPSMKDAIETPSNASRINSLKAVSNSLALNSQTHLPQVSFKTFFTLTRMVDDELISNQIQLQVSNVAVIRHALKTILHDSSFYSTAGYTKHAGYIRNTELKREE